jgi:hypothetical protein
MKRFRAEPHGIQLVVRHPDPRRVTVVIRLGFDDQPAAGVVWAING